MAAPLYTEIARLATLDLGEPITPQEIANLVDEGVYPPQLEEADRRDLWATVAKELLTANVTPPLACGAEAFGPRGRIPAGAQRRGPIGRTSLEEGLLELAIGSKAVADLKALGRSGDG